MPRRSTRILAAAVAALALTGCGRAAERAHRREDRRDDRAAQVTAGAQAGDDVTAREGEANAIESELDAIDSLLTED